MEGENLPRSQIYESDVLKKEVEPHGSITQGLTCDLFTIYVLDPKVRDLGCDLWPVAAVRLVWSP